MAVSTQPLWCKTSRKCLKQVDATGEKKIFANQSLFQVAKAHTKFIHNQKIPGSLFFQTFFEKIKEFKLVWLKSTNVIIKLIDISELMISLFYVKTQKKIKIKILQS